MRAEAEKLADQVRQSLALLHYDRVIPCVRPECFPGVLLLLVHRSLPLLVAVLAPAFSDDAEWAALERGPLTLLAS